MKVSGLVDMALSLHEVLVVVVPDLHRHCRDPWTLIGSAAARLVGAEVAVADLDVLTSVRDAEALIGHWRLWRDETHVSPGAERFRSRFAASFSPACRWKSWAALSCPASAAGCRFRSMRSSHWTWADSLYRFPRWRSRSRMLESFGRPKDRQRAVLLKSIYGEERL